MPTDRRRSDARRRAWGRGPMILRFEPLEGRELLSTTVVSTSSGTTTAAATSTTSAAPDLVGGSFDTLHNLDWGDAFHAKGAILNQGNVAVASAFKVDFYASPTSGLNTSTAVLLGEATVPAGLQPGQSAPIDQTLLLPTTPLSGVGSDQKIYIEMVIDPKGAVPESNTQNNSGLGQGYDLSTVTITPHQPANLIGTSIGVYPGTAQWGSTVGITSQLQNNGAGAAPSTRARFVITPKGYAPGGSADYTVGNMQVPAIAAGQSTVVTQNITFPSMPPAYLAGATQYILSVVPDADYAISPVYPHIATQGIGFDMADLTIALPTTTTTQGPKPDLAPVSVLAPTQPIAFGQTFQVTTTIQNSGNLDAPAYRVRFLLVGTNGDLTQGLFLGDTVLSDGLKAGYTQNVIQTLKFPSRLPLGVGALSNQARIAVEVDPENNLGEPNRANNAAVSGLVTLQLVRADGTIVPITSTSAPTTVTTPAAVTATATTTTTTATPTAKAATTPVPAATTPAQKIAAKAAALAAAKAKRAAMATTSAQKIAAAKAKRAALATRQHATTHTFKHNLQVFPKNVERFFKKLVKGK